MRRALIEPGGRIAQIENHDFPVAEPLVWVDVPDETTTFDTYVDGAVVKAPALVQPPAPPAVTYPGEFWMNATEAEAEVIVAKASTMSIRDQQIFQRATVFVHGLPETERLRALLTEAFGATRAAEILAPSA